MAKVNVRNRNEGKFYKDGRKKPANWEYRFEAAKVDGKRNTISKAGFATKKDAEIAGAKALSEYDTAGSHFTPSEISYSDYLDYWFKNYVMMNCKPRTRETYNRIIENHIKPILGVYRLKALSPSIIQEYVNSKVKNGLKKGTLSGIFAIITSSLKYAVHPSHFIQSSPAEYVKLPKMEHSKNEVNRTVISIDDFERMIDRFDVGNPFRYSLLIGFYTGLRIGEVYGLTWDDIDLENGTLTVSKGMYKRNFGVDSRKVIKEKGKKEEICGWYVGTPKTHASNRTIKIGDTLINELREYKAIQEKNKTLYEDYYTQQYMKQEMDDTGATVHRIVSAESSIPVALPKINLVIRKENGELSTMDSFKYCARVIHYDLGITFNFHSLRHTHATMLIEAGVSPKTVQKRLGHENIETTLQTYVHDTDEMAENAVDTFEDIINKKMSTKSVDKN